MEKETIKNAALDSDHKWGLRKRELHAGYNFNLNVWACGRPPASETTHSSAGTAYAALIVYGVIFVRIRTDEQKSCLGSLALRNPAFPRES